MAYNQLRHGDWNDYARPDVNKQTTPNIRANTLVS